MKKILIISPHFPPSNLAAVHRSRLFAMHLPKYGWQPTILTVDEQYYEEQLDWNLYKLLPADLRVVKANAYQVTKPRIIGDIGLRAFFQLYKKAKQIIQQEQFDFLYIPIPSFYIALLGRWLHTTTGIQYGIDYIDPWVHEFAGSNKLFSRHWFSTKLSAFLEPIAVKHVSLITGVAEGYYKDVLIRNKHLQNKVLTAAMPYGGEQSDHDKLASLNIKSYLFTANPQKIQLVYAGAMLPKAYSVLEAVFKSIASNKAIFESVEFHFIGTGKSPNDKHGFNIKPLAEKFGLWQEQIFEYPARIPYLDVLVHLQAVQGVFILGSTEPHYTPSKVYQGVLSHKPILAVLHQQSTASSVIESSLAGMVLSFHGAEDVSKIANSFTTVFQQYKKFAENFSTAKVDYSEFSQYSAKSVTLQLATALNKIVP